ncbi:hypothetical protein [Fodinicola feengrottensis]|uniref:hypothetical protein n=1 Tax=Fodinicola feengrottensis TaxID=435914 RepID=UPI0024434254|nr:hypothetical protein [Fodinicola feengrottensis]
MWQILLAYGRTRAVGGDQHICGGAAAVTEICRHAVRVLLVPYEGFVEMDHVVHAGQQHLPEDRPGHRPLTVDRVAVVSQVN